MRPASEIRTALLQAAHHFQQQGQQPTLLELSRRAQVGIAAATTTVKNMTRSGQLQICGLRRVDYRNRPVAEYTPASQPIELQPAQVLQSAMSGWIG